MLGTAELFLLDCRVGAIVFIFSLPFSSKALSSMLRSPASGLEAAVPSVWVKSPRPHLLQVELVISLHFQSQSALGMLVGRGQEVSKKKRGADVPPEDYGDRFVVGAHRAGRAFSLSPRTRRSYDGDGRGGSKRRSAASGGVFARCRCLQRVSKQMWNTAVPWRCLLCIAATNFPPSGEGIAVPLFFTKSCSYPPG